MRLVILLCLFFSIHLQAQEVPQLDTFVLNNGMKLYLLQCDGDADLNVKLIINGGKINENECEVGYSEIIRGLINASLNEKQGPFLKKEKRLSCDIKNGQTILSGNCSMTDLNKEIEMLCATVARLAFIKDKIDQAVAEIGDHYDPLSISADRLCVIFKNLLLYGPKHPLGRSYCQYAMQKVLPEELREFYIAHYTPKRASIIVTGNFKVYDVKKIIAKNFVKWRSFIKEENVPVEPELNMPPIKSKEIVFINKLDSENYTLKWVVAAPSFKSADHPAFIVSCILFDRYLKERSNALNFDPLAYTNGIAETNCIVDKNNLTDVIKLFDTSLHIFHNLNFTEDEVKKITKSLKSTYLKKNSPETISSFYDPLAFNFGAQKNFLTNLSRVSVIDIKMILENYFIPGAYKLIIVGKEHIVKYQLELLGNVNLYKPADLETCDDACKEVVIFKCHCESCYRRGYCNIWRFNPKDKDAIKSAKAKVKQSK